MPKFGGAPSCPRCGKAVYLAEQCTGPGGLWHKTCLTCKECNKRLDSTSLTEREREAYCKTCYGKLFGPKGYGFGGGAGVLSTDATITDAQRFSPSPSPSASREGSQSNLAGGAGGSSSSPRSQSTSSLPGTASAASVTPGSAAGSAPTVAKPKFGSADVCPKCQKAVYFAEQTVGPMGVKYHKLCFRCAECNKLVDSTTMADKEGVIYCRACHGRKFGPKGYGYAGGAAGLTTV